jgi:serine/threonine protein kinase/tetratricopeptide (TPR) repeat protein
MAFDPARVKSLVLEASDLPSLAERNAYLDRECGGEPELRARVEALLAASDRAGPAPDPEVAGMDDRAAAETRPGSSVSDPDAGLATVGAAGGGGRQDFLLAEVPAATGPGRFVPGQVIAGRYTLLEVLGEGGMGTVYRAEQSRPVRRQVALKLIRVGMDSRTVLARFDAERQALALMDHPNIARVYDGGATEANQPFFVMELVRGVPITGYCDRHRLSVDARLQLFVAVCQAVQHAHQKGIIHRDIKPSNVMVTEVDGRPTPKVIDFGVAKATESNLTDQSLGDTGAIVGTPTYMSPEQADPSTQDIDTRTDVYALGVILYELLAGSPPLDAAQFRRGALLEILRMVREVDPSKPSTKVSTADALPNIAANRGIDPERLKRELRGDLDWIVMKALEKDRTRRYETANGFASDILRHLSNEPVQAAPPSRAYRLRKFVRKHRVGVLAASLVLFALLAGIAGTTLALLEARRQEGLANKREQGERLAKQNALAAAEEEKKAKETVEDVLGFVEDKVFAAARPKNQPGGLGYDVKLADAIRAALPSIETRFRNKPLTEARLRRTIGTSFHFLGKSEITVQQFEAARSLYTRELGPDHPDTIGIMNRLAVAYADLGKKAEALKLREEALALRKAKLGPDHPDTIASRGNLALSYMALGRNAEAVKIGEETLALEKANRGPDHPETITSMQVLALGYSSLGRQAEAIKLYEEALPLAKTRLGPDHTETIRIIHNLASAYDDVGRHVEALKLGEEELALRKAKLGPDHPMTLNSMRNVAAFLSNVGRHADAVKLREETLPLQKTVFGPDHHETLNTMMYLADGYDALGRLADALKLHQETLALRKAKLGPDHPDTLMSMNHLADIYLTGGRIREALPLLAECSTADPKDTNLSLKVAALQAWFGHDKELAATRRRILANAEGTEDAHTADRAANACGLLPSAGKAELDASIVLARRAVDLGKDSEDLDFFLMHLGIAEYRAGDFAKAEASLTAAMDRGKGHPHRDAGLTYFVDGTSSFYRAMCLFRQGKNDEARTLATEDAAKMKPLPADDQNPLADGASPDDLILWLAYKEAKALIGFDATPAAPAKPAGR